MNKKGFGYVGIILIGIAILLVFMFGTGALSSFILKNTFKNIPAWFWVGLVFFVLIILGGKKK